MAKSPNADTRAIDECVRHFEEHKHLFEGFAKSVTESLRLDAELSKYIHFIKYRLKSANRLREKLEKKRRRRERPAITASNLFQQINDLAGIRILHLHLDQIGEISKHINRVLTAAKIRVIEGPTAKVWDSDYQTIFGALGIESQVSDSMYTSVHYVLEANEKTKITFELQVRTLAEELWGEISHRVAYEEAVPNKGVMDQLKVLARLTSGATRLADCIVATFEAASEESPVPSKKEQLKRPRKRIQKGRES